MKANLIHRVARRAAAWRFRWSPPRATDGFASSAPNPKQTADIFHGIWASHLPIPGVESGPSKLFDDYRLNWLLERLGGTAGMEILELGPLEGGHTTMLERGGAAFVQAIEGNPSCYLRCLVVKELFELKATRFEFGDFQDYLRTCERRYDLVLAAGVLYHLFDPLQLLLDLARVTDRIFIWSHFFDDSAMPKGDARRGLVTGETHRRVIDGEALTYHYKTYGGNRGRSAKFIGGGLTKVAWVDLNEVLDLLRRKGFAAEIVLPEPDHPHGPAACIYAERS